MYEPRFVDDAIANAAGPTRATHGTVKMINLAKGWGFLRPDSGEDVFFHRSVVRGQPWEFVEQGQPVTFEVGDRRDGKGPRAERVWFA